MEVRGRALAVVAADALRGAGADPVVAIGGNGPALAALGLTVAPDEHPGEGPLGGILTALRFADEVVVVLACDLPHASPDAVAAVLAALGDDADAAVPVVDGRPEPLHAAWRTSARAPLAAAFAAGERSVVRALEGLRWVAVEGIAPARLADADTPDTLGS